MMKYRGLIIIVLFFLLMFFYNTFTPLMTDDYFMSFVWPVGAEINALSENARKIASFSDIFDSLKGYYLTWGGRLPGQSFIMFFLWQEKFYFNIANSFMFVLLITEIYWLAHEGKLTFKFDASYIFWIFFSLWTFNIAFVDTVLWLSGSCDYLWPLVLLLAFLLPYVRDYYDGDSLKQDKIVMSAGMLFLGLLAGCSRETLVFWIIIFLSTWLYHCKKKRVLQFWKITGYIGLCIGYGLLIFAPGNAVRFSMLTSASTSIFSNNELLSYKLTELALTLLFHLLLWHFLISFYFRFKGKIQEDANKKYLNIVWLSVILAIFSGISMFLIPSRGVRISFVSLVFLLIGVTTIFRIQEIEKIEIIDRKARLLMKKLGCLYLVLTACVSLMGNYYNWNYWNHIITQLENPKNKSECVLIQVIRPLTEQNDLWFYGSGFVHLTGLPIYDNGPLNVLISRYYGVKGINIVAEK